MKRILTNLRLSSPVDYNLTTDENYFHLTNKKKDISLSFHDNQLPYIDDYEFNLAEKI
jgi:hypothetical protein